MFELSFKFGSVQGNVKGSGMREYRDIRNYADALIRRQDALVEPATGFLWLTKDGRIVDGYDKDWT
jgi:hypothetical protein